MAAAGQAATAARPRPHTRARRAPAQRRVAGGFVSIAVVAVLLAGVVALNVAVLRLNVRLDRLDSERAKLRAENAVLASRLSSAAAARGPIAQERLGLLSVVPTYLELRPDAK
jgi:hypothetical protein